MTKFARGGKFGLLLEAEVAPRQQLKFENRYKAATGRTVSPGSPAHYQNQPGKWGAELRGYFNDPGMAAALEALGVHVEYRDSGYMAGQYCHRFNNNKLWWKLVGDYGMRLGDN